MLPDFLAQGLKVIFVGYNPGLLSDELGHHFAGRNNQFWRLLYEAGLTPELISPEKDHTMLEYGFGLTNIVARPSKSSSDLTWTELRQGALELQQKVNKLQPQVLCLLGKQVYLAYAGLKQGAKIDYGLQEPFRNPGVVDYLAPNPSGRSTVPLALKRDYLAGLKDFYN